MNDKNDKPLITFPCEFPIKIFGENSSDFRTAVKAITDEHIDKKHIISSSENKGKSDKFLAITILVLAQNQTQLDSVYQALTNHKAVIMAL